VSCASHEDIIESALHDWHAVLEVMSDGPFGNEPTGLTRRDSFEATTE
jgi:hypothetical protein